MTQRNKHSYQRNSSRRKHLISSTFFFFLLSLSRTPHLITRWVSPPTGSGALLLEWPSWWHVRGLPRRQAPLLCPHHGRGPLLPRQHASSLHGSKQTGEYNITYESPCIITSLLLLSYRFFITLKSVIKCVMSEKHVVLYPQAVVDVLCLNNHIVPSFKRLFIVFSFTSRPRSCLRSQQSIHLLSFQRDVRWNISQAVLSVRDTFTSISVTIC